MKKYNISYEFKFSGESPFVVTAEDEKKAKKLAEEFLKEKIPSSFYGVALSKINVKAVEVLEGENGE